eukprot:99041_1
MSPFLAVILWSLSQSAEISPSFNDSNCCHPRLNDKAKSKVDCTKISNVDECARIQQDDCLWFCDVDDLPLLQSGLKEINFVEIQSGKSKTFTAPSKIFDNTSASIFHTIDTYGVVYEVVLDKPFRRHLLGEDDDNWPPLSWLKYKKKPKPRLLSVTGVGILFHPAQCVGTVIRSKPIFRGKGISSRRAHPPLHNVDVLTAAHCVWNKKQKKFEGIYDFKFFLEWNKKQSPDIKWHDRSRIPMVYQEVRRLWVPAAYKQRPSASHDVGIIRFRGYPAMQYAQDISFNDMLDPSKEISVKSITYDIPQCPWEVGSDKPEDCRMRTEYFKMRCRDRICDRTGTISAPAIGAPVPKYWKEGNSGTSLFYHNTHSVLDGKIIAVLSKGTDDAGVTHKGYMACRITKDIVDVIRVFSSKKINNRQNGRIGYTSAHLVDNGRLLSQSDFTSPSYDNVYYIDMLMLSGLGFLFICSYGLICAIVSVCIGMTGYLYKNNA